MDSMNSISDISRPSRFSMSIQPALHLLSYRVRILSVEKSSLPLVTHSLLRITLKLLQSDPSYRRECFYCFTETCSEYSLLLDQKLYEDLLDECSCTSAISIAEGVWRPIVIELGAFGSLTGISKIAASVITPLADEGVSVFCLSSNQEDYVMVKEDDLKSALNCLCRRFKLISDSNRLDDTKLVESFVSSQTFHNRYPTDRNNVSRPITHPFTSSSDKYCVCTILSSLLPSITQPLLQIMFFNSSTSTKKPFFSFSLISDSASMIIDSKDFSRFPMDCVYSDDIDWRVFTIGSGPLGFEECGIVAQISRPLAEEEISTFYICTYKTDHILIPESSVAKTLKVLNQSNTNDIATLPSAL